MKEKNVKHYFEAARKLPLGMVFSDVEKLVNIKGVINPPPSNWWNSNFRLMTTIGLIIGISTLLTLNSEESIYTPSIQPKEIKDYSNEFSNSGLNLEIESEDLDSKESVNDMEVMPYKASSFDVFENHDTQEALKTPAFTLKDYLSPEELEIVDLEKDVSEVNEDSAQTNGKMKQIELSHDLKGVDWFVLSNSRGNIRVESWDQNQVKITAIADIETKDKAQEEAAVADFELEWERKGNHLSIGSNWKDLLNCVCSFSSDNKKNQIKTDEGEKIRIKKVTVSYTVYLPSDIKVDLKNSYADIILPQWNSDVKLNAFKGDIFTENIEGNVMLSQKYGKAKLGNYKKLELEAFKAEVELGQGEQISGKSNYSDLRTGKVDEMELNTFKGNTIVEQITSQFDLNIRYGDITLKENSNKGELYAFKSDIELQSLEQLILNASYSDLNATSIADLQLNKAFQSKLKIDQVKKVGGQAKYTPIEFGRLDESMELVTFKGKVDIKELSSGFNLLKLESKYTDLNFKVNPDAKYNFNLESYYASINLPESEFNMKYQNKQNHKSEIEAAFNGGDANSFVDLNLFQGSLSLR